MEATGQQKHTRLYHDIPDDMEKTQRPPPPTRTHTHTPSQETVAIDTISGEFRRQHVTPGRCFILRKDVLDVLKHGLFCNCVSLKKTSLISVPSCANRSLFISESSLMCHGQRKQYLHSKCINKHAYARTHARTHSGRRRRGQLRDSAPSQPLLVND